ncbi:MAG: alkaline phosphatase family protein [Luteitalea sp.]|nr:alkaline phosphatase family protein [Luteitalea sp.]
MKARPFRDRLLLLPAAGLAAFSLASCDPAAPQGRHLLIVVDGLRPDYVTPEVMPNLHALGQRGAVFTGHHSVFPTVTRVNASSISTGAYPETHGLMGNSVFFPQVDATTFLDTDDRANLLNIAGATGKLLTAPTLGESLQAAGKRMLVVSSGSSGSSFLLNHRVAGGAILHPEYALPGTLQQEMQTALGDAPPEDAPPGTRDRHAIDAFLKVGIPRVDPSVTVMWLTELDSTAHAHGIGDPAVVDILRRVDASIEVVEDGLKAAGLFDVYNIWVTSDHGFSSHTGAADVQAVVTPHTVTHPDGSPSVVTGGGAIYVRDRRDDTVSAITATLQRTPGVGAIFTRGVHAGSFDGRIAGTLSFDLARWSHERSADILFSPDWTDGTNPHGFKGTSALNGIAGHGSSSPFDIHNTLIAAGPDLRRGATIDVPSGNVDFAPTFLRLLGLPIPSSMQGRVLEEAFTSGPDPASIGVRADDHQVANQDGSYRLTSFFSVVESGRISYRYLDRTQVERTAAPRATAFSSSP